MRHNNANNNLGRKTAHRKSMLSNMASSLIMHKRIKTTTAKAKVLRGFIEPILTKSKEDTTHSRRLAFTYLQDKDAVSALFRDVSPKITDRPGGYTRILKIGSRAGDAAEMCYIELVDFNEAMLGTSAAETKTTRRSRRGTKKKTEGADESTAKTVKAAGSKAAASKKAAPKAEPKAEEKAPEAQEPAAEGESETKE